MNAPSNRSAHFILHLVIIAWGFTAILGKLISIPALEVALWRTLLASGGLVILCLLFRQPLVVKRGDALRMLANGLMVGLHWIAFFQSARLASASIALAALTTTLIWCSLLEPLLIPGKRWRWIEGATGLAMIVAAALIYRVEISSGKGFTVGLLAAFIGAVFAVLNKPLTDRIPPLTNTCYQMTGAWIMCALVFGLFIDRPFEMPATQDWWWLAILAGVCTIGAYAAYLYVLRQLSIFSINVVYNLEPVYGMILAFLIFRQEETLTPGFYVGVGIILVAVMSVPWLDRKSQGDIKDVRLNEP